MKTILPHSWEVPQVFRDRLGSSAGRQRAMVDDGHLLLVLHQPPGPDDTTRTGRFLWRDAKGTWRSSDGGSGIAAVHKHLDEYARVLEKYDSLEEAAASAEHYLALLEGASPIVRAARNMLQVFEEARKAIREDRDLIDCRDRAYELSRTAEQLYADAKNSMDVAVIRRAEQQAAASERMALGAHRLNVLAALFFPVATLGAVFGTSLTEEWWMSYSVLPFTAFVAVGLLSGIVLALFITRGERHSP